MSKTTVVTGRTSTNDLLEAFRAIAERFDGAGADIETACAIREILSDRDTAQAREALAEVDAWLA